jgi:hypothetical protein
MNGVTIKYYIPDCNLVLAYLTIEDIQKVDCTWHTFSFFLKRIMFGSQGFGVRILLDSYGVESGSGGWKSLIN